MLTRWLEHVPTRFYCQKSIFGHFPIEIPIEVGKNTTMGRKRHKAKTKIVLISVSKVDQHGSMPNLEFQTLSQ